jgi:hypothetical protein
MLECEKLAETTINRYGNNKVASIGCVYTTTLLEFGQLFPAGVRLL